MVPVHDLLQDRRRPGVEWPRRVPWSLQPWRSTVKRFIRTPHLLLSVSLVAAVVLMMAVVVARQPTEKWSPQFPRDGTTKLFENEHVIVWEQIGRPREPFAHRHIRDILTFSVEPGQVEVLGPDLQPPSTTLSDLEFDRAQRFDALLVAGPLSE